MYLFFILNMKNSETIEKHLDVIKKKTFKFNHKNQISRERQNQKMNWRVFTICISKKLFPFISKVSFKKDNLCNRKMT